MNFDTLERIDLPDEIVDKLATVMGSKYNVSFASYFTNSVLPKDCYFDYWKDPNKRRETSLTFVQLESPTDILTPIYRRDTIDGSYKIVVKDEYGSMFICESIRHMLHYEFIPIWAEFWFPPNINVFGNSRLVYRQIHPLDTLEQSFEMPLVLKFDHRRSNEQGVIHRFMNINSYLTFRVVPIVFWHDGRACRIDEVVVKTSQAVDKIMDSPYVDEESTVAITKLLESYRQLKGW